jgi:hypothetical protein
VFGQLKKSLSEKQFAASEKKNKRDGIKSRNLVDDIKHRGKIIFFEILEGFQQRSTNILN